MTKRFRRLAVIAMVGALAGCGSLTGADSNLFSEVKSCQNKADQVQEVVEDADAEGAVTRNLERLDAFLDCYVGPARTERAELYRGHVIVALLARWAAFNLTGEAVDPFGFREQPQFDLDYAPYAGRQEDALLILTALYKAEADLRLGLQALTSPSAGDEPIPDLSAVADKYRVLMKAKRIVAVWRVVVAAEQPTIARAKSLFRDALSGIRGSIPSARRAIRNAAKGLGKWAFAGEFAPAYLAGAKQDLISWSGNEPDAEAWERWDTLIRQACRQVARVAGLPPRCIPTKEELELMLGS